MGRAAAKPIVLGRWVFGALRLNPPYGFRGLNRSDRGNDLNQVKETEDG
jgi:hypothetical protein